MARSACPFNNESANSWPTANRSSAAMDLSGITAEQFRLVFNACSFTIAVMGAATASGSTHQSRQCRIDRYGRARPLFRR